MYHNFFIHSSIDGHLDCFHVLAVVNSATVNRIVDTVREEEDATNWESSVETYTVPYVK